MGTEKMNMTITWQMCMTALEGCGEKDYAAARRYIEATHRVPDWFEIHFRNAAEGKYKFSVRHQGETFDLYAKSEADAKNIIRYNRYGTTPESRLALFEVRQFFPNIAEAVKMARAETPAEKIAAAGARRPATSNAAKAEILKRFFKIK